MVVKLAKWGLILLASHIVITPPWSPPWRICWSFLQGPVIVCLVVSFFLGSLLYHSIWERKQEKRERIFAAARLMGCKVASKLESKVLSTCACNNGATKLEAAETNITTKRFLGYSSALSIYVFWRIFMREPEIN